MNQVNHKNNSLSLKKNQKNEATLLAFLSLIKEQKLLISLVFLIVFSLFAVYLLIRPKQFESDTLIQVTNKSNNLGEFESLPKVFDSSASPSDVQRALIFSRFILEPVITKMNLTISTEPHYFPLLGRFIQFRNQNNNHHLSKPWLGLSKYAWGGEKINVSRLQVPDNYKDQVFKLVTTGSNHYQIYDSKNKLVLTGQVGVLEHSNANYHSSIKILVNILNANKGAEFWIKSRHMSDVVEDIQKKLSIVEVGSTDELNMKTGILKISLNDIHPQKIADIVNTIVKMALQADTKNKMLEATKTLSFLNNQIVEVKKSLVQAELALSAYRIKHEKLDLNLETTLLVNNIAEIDKQIFETKLKKTQLLQYYTANHPFIIELDNTEEKLKQKLNLLEQQVKMLPLQNQTAINLVRDVKIKNELYLILYKKMQELQVVAAGTLSDIRILSIAKFPDKPIPSHAIIKLLAATFIAATFGILVGLVRTALYRKIHDPNWTEQNLNITNLAIIPYSKKQASINRLMNKNISLDSKILGFNSPYDLSIESLKSLRTHLQFITQIHRNNIIAIVGIAPNIGKTFITSNLAYIMAEAGKRTLLIDSDMRRGQLGSYFDLPRNPGLSEYLMGLTDVENIIQKSSHPHLEVITSGKLVNESSELLSKQRFDDLIQQVHQKYEFVLFDTAPILAVTDSLIVAKKANINILLLGSSMHYPEEIEFAIKKLYTNGIKVQGTIYNHSKPENLAIAREYRYFYEYEKA